MRTHSFGQAAEKAVEKAREQVAELIGAYPLEVIWTSGATESNNLAIKGAVYANKNKQCHIVTVKTDEIANSATTQTNGAMTLVVSLNHPQSAP